MPFVFAALFSGIVLIGLIQDFEEPFLLVFLLITLIFSLSNAYLFIKLVNDESYLTKSLSHKDSIIKKILSSIYIFSGIAFILFFFKNIYGILFNSTIVINGMKLRTENVTLWDFIYLIVGVIIILDAYFLIIKKQKY